MRAPLQTGIIAVAIALLSTSVATAAPGPRPGPRTSTERPSRPALASPSGAPTSAIAQPRRSWWRWSYLIDWGLTLAVGGAGAGINLAKPHTRTFTPNSPRIDHAQRGDTVPSIWLVLTAVLPLATIGIAQAAGPSVHDIHHASLALGETLAVTLLITGVLKTSIGRLRPDFLDRCQPDAALRCTGDPEEVREGRLSFPSGHSSLSFAAGTFMSLYLWGKLSPLGGLHWLWKVPVLLLPMATASFVAWSRVHDRRHHWEDVLGGSLIGVGAAALGYLLNHHPPWSARAGQPRRRGALQVSPVAGTDRVGLLMGGQF